MQSTYVNSFTGVSGDQVSELIQEVVIVHSSLDLCLSILAVAALASLRIAEHTHLEALAILLLTVGFLAPASCDVPGVDVRQLRTLGLARSPFDRQLLLSGSISVTCIWSMALHEGLSSLALLDEEAVWTLVLNLGLERLWIPVSYIPSSSPDLVGVRLKIVAILASAAFIAEAALGEALTVHLQAFGPGALAGQGLDGGALLLEQSQLWVECHRCLPLDGLLPWASRPTLP